MLEQERTFAEGWGDCRKIGVVMQKGVMAVYQRPSTVTFPLL